MVYAWTASRNEAGLPGLIHDGREVLDDARLDLVAQDASAPAVDDVRPIRRLQERGQLLLVGLVLKVLDVDLHARMGGLVASGDVVPEAADLLVLLDMQHPDGHVGECRRHSDT